MMMKANNTTILPKHFFPAAENKLCGESVNMYSLMRLHLFKPSMNFQLHGLCMQTGSDHIYMRMV